MSTQSGELTIATYTFDDSLIQECLEGRIPRYGIRIPDSTEVVLGRGSNPDRELNSEACSRDNVRILRRHGGGCSVVLDPGNIVVSVVLPANGIKDNQRFFDILSDRMIDIMTRIGIKGVYQAGISDLMLGDRKIGGSSIHRTQDYIYYSTTLLVDPNIELIERYLKYPPREPDHRNNRAHREFVGSLRNSGIRHTPAELADKIDKLIELDTLSGH